VEEIRLLFLALFILVFFVVLNIYLARVLPGGELFYLRWSGARAFLVDRIEPYSTTIAERTQNVAYGRTAFSSEYPYVLNDPFHIVLLYIPLALFSDFTVARGLWMLLSEIALMGCIYYVLKLIEWEPPRWLLVLIISMGSFGYYSLIAFGSGTPTVILTFLFILILFSLHTFSDEFAGALLFLTAYQWEVSGLFFLFIMFMVFANRRWGVLTGFGMSLFIFLVVSFLAYPGWGLPYVRAVLSDWYRGANMNFGHILSFWFPDSRISIGIWTSVALGGILLLEWIGSIESNFRHILWTASLTLAAASLMGFAIFPTNHVVLLPALILITMLVWERWTRQRVWFVLLVLLITLLVPFGLYIRVITNYNRLVLDLLTVLPPIGAIIGLYWMRWWAFRSPRTWFDQIGDRK
jgi:hypothetical protein